MFGCLVGRVVVTGSVGSSPGTVDASSIGEVGPVGIFQPIKNKL